MYTESSDSVLVDRYTDGLIDVQADFARLWCGRMWNGDNNDMKNKYKTSIDCPENCSRQKLGPDNPS